MFDFEYRLSTICAPNFIQNTDVLIILGNTRAENKGLITSKVGFQTMFFYINFGATK